MEDPVVASDGGTFDNYESVSLMLQDPRVDINLANNNGWPPLMNACYHENTQIVQLLLSYGRNIDIHKKSTKDEDFYCIKSDSTALDIAKQENITDIVQFLEQYQNNPKETQKTKKQKTKKKKWCL